MAHQYYPHASVGVELKLAGANLRSANVRAKALADGQHTAPGNGLAEVFEIDAAEARGQEARNIAAFARGREALKAKGLRIYRSETYWDGRDAIEVINSDGLISTVSERDCYAASQYGDEAGCLYFYLHRLLRPTLGMRKSIAQ